MGITDFSDRIGDALNEVASAQSDSASLTKAYEMGAEHDLSKVMVQQQVLARFSNDAECPQQGSQRLQRHYEHAGVKH